MEWRNTVLKQFVRLAKIPQPLVTTKHKQIRFFMTLVWAIAIDTKRTLETKDMDP